MPAVLIWTGKVGSGFVRRNYANNKHNYRKDDDHEIKAQLTCGDLWRRLDLWQHLWRQAFFNSPLAATVITGPSTSAWATKCTSTQFLRNH